MTEVVGMITALQEKCKLLCAQSLEIFDMLEALKQKAIIDDAATNAVQEQQRPNLTKRPVEPTGAPDRLIPGKQITFAKEGERMKKGDNNE